MADLFRGLHARTADSILTADSIATLPTSGVEGDIRYVKDIDQLYTYNGATWQAAGGGGGVIGPTGGPGATTDNAVTRWDGNDGTKVQNSGVIIDDSNNVTGATSVAVTQDPTTSLQLATKQYVDAGFNGLKWKTSVRAATTTAGTLATSFANGQTIDGVSLVTGNRILVKDQASAAEDGIYTVNASGAPTRASDAATFGALNGAVALVQEGTANADKGFQQVTELTSFSSQSWIQNFGTGLYTADNQGISLSGSTFSLVLDGTSLAKSASGIKVNISGAPVGTTDTQTISNKTLGNTNSYLTKANALTLQDATDTTKQANFLLSGITTATTRTYGLPNANVTLVGDGSVQTISNKTLDNTNVAALRDGNFSLQSTGDATKLLALSLTGITTGTTRTLTIPDLTGTLALTTGAQTFSNKTLDNTTTLTIKANALTLQDQTDITKQALFSAAGITTATTRTYTLPNASDTLAVLALAQTLTNKTLDNTTTLTIKTNALTLQDSTDVTKQVLFSAAGLTTATTRTLTVPDTSGTLVLTTATQNLTNKDLTSATNTFTVASPTQSGIVTTGSQSLGGAKTFTTTGGNTFTIVNSDTTNATRITAQTGSGTTSSRNSTLSVESLETVPQRWDMGLIGDKNLSITDISNSRPVANFSATTGALALMFAPNTPISATDLGTSAATYAPSSQLKSGRFTPAYVNLGNTTAATVTANTMQWIEVGKLVHCFGWIQVTVTAGTVAIPADTQFTLTLPITPTSNFSGTTEVVGSGAAIPTQPAQFDAVVVYATNGAKTATVQYGSSGSGANRSVYYNFSYQLN